MTQAGAASSALARHVPRLVREWAVEPTPAVRHRTIHGSMLFADVSGFTRLSERLAREGRVGAETTVGLITTCFTRLLDQAYRNGGTLLQFAGDAVLLLFRGDGHERRAAAAALDMRRALYDLRRDDDLAARVALSMTVGVASGEVDAFLVGRSHHQLVIGGPLASRLVELEGSAQRGRILIDDAVAAALPRRNVGPRAGTGSLLRGPVPVEPVDAVEFLTTAVDMGRLVAPEQRKAVESGTVHSEHRSATLAFVDFGGLDRLIAERGHDEAAATLDAFVVGVQEAIDPRSICLQSVDVGVDGGKLYLSAGAPHGTGHDEENMLLALREIVALDVGFELRAGANAGSVFTGEIGTRHRSTFLTMGDAVNVAARVTAKGSVGDVLATPAVLDRSKTTFRTTALAPFSVKGKRRPVTAYQVGPPSGVRRRVASADLPLVGRDEEVASFRAAVSRASAGRGSFIDLAAEAGGGCSRLLQQFRVEAGPTRFVGVGGRPYQQSTPYFAAGVLLGRLLGLEDRPPEDRAERLRDLAERAGVDDRFALIAGAARLEVDTTGVDDLEPDFRRALLHSSVVRLLTETITEPTVLCFEDAQWIDDASRDLLGAIVRDVHSRPWVIVVGRRRQPGDPHFTDRAPDSSFVLQPLDHDAQRQLLAAATEQSPLAPHVADDLVARSGGNPLFLLELADAVQAGESPDELPDSLDRVLTARIDRLTANDRVLLRHMSVLGSGFEQRFVADVAPQSVHDLAAAVGRLDEFVTVDDRRWVEFRHHLIREVAYAGLPYRTRRRLHEQVADSLVARAGNDAATAPLLSVHFHHAHRHDEAWRYSVVAGHHAADAFANAEAATFYERALASARHLALADDDRASTLERLGDVQDLAGMYDAARRSYADAARLRTGKLARAELGLKSAFIDERLGRFPTAIRSIRRSRRLVDGETTVVADDLRARLAVWTAAIRLRQGRFADAAAASAASAEVARRVGNRSTLARAQLTLDFAESSLGREVDFHRSQEALEIYTELDELGGIATAANVLGGYAYFAGQWEEAATLYRRGAEVRLRTGDLASAAVCDANLAEIFVEQGHLDDADALLADALAVWRAAGDAGGVAFARRLRGIGRGRAGDFDEASELLDQARAGYEQIGAGVEVMETDVSIAELLLLRGDQVGAGRIVDSMLASDLAGAGADHLVPALLRIGALCLDDVDTAAAAIERAIRAARESGADLDVMLALEADGWIRRRRGEPPNPGFEVERAEIGARLGVGDRAAPPAWISGTGTADRR